MIKLSVVVGISLGNHLCRLLFHSFLKPSINGKGFDFKESNISEEGRMDIGITFGIHRYVLELKRREGEAYHQENLGQLNVEILLIIQNFASRALAPHSCSRA